MTNSEYLEILDRMLDTYATNLALADECERKFGRQPPCPTLEQITGGDRETLAALRRRLDQRLGAAS